MKFGLIPESRYDEVIQFLRHHFPDEPLNVSVGLCKKDVPCELLEHHHLETLKDGLSVMATDPDNGQIAGVSLNGVAHPGDVEKELEELRVIDSLEYRRIFGLLSTVNKEADLFSKYPVDRIFELRILSVDNAYRGKGLGKEICRRSEAIALENGFRLLKTDATSLFTQKIAESLGFTVAKSVKYHDYTDEDGHKIYDTKSPHDYYKIMIKEINSEENVSKV